MSELLLSEKYKAFLKCNCKAEFLEGTTARGKTTVGLFKFIMKCAQSEKRIHILSGLDLGTIEKNIITKELGILDDFGPLTEYYPHGGNGNIMPHIELRTKKDTKIIYVLGYDNKARWKKALGGQYGCRYIDEINIADIDFVREVFMRSDYVLATLNPDDPDLSVYSEFINKSRPLEQWAKYTPPEILEMLNESPNEGWVHWFFNFNDNLGLSEDKKRQIIENVPPGTKVYKNKIEGLRGRSTGLIFDLRKENIITLQQAKQLEYITYSIGIDTSYSQTTADTFALVFDGITRDKKLVTLAEEVYNNAELKTPLSPSDLPKIIVNFADRCRNEFGFARDIFIDSADRASITELKKYKRENGSIYNFLPAWKKMKILDRLNLQIGWMAKGQYLIADRCKNSIREYNSYSWQEDKNEPEDGHDHTINANQYAFLPFVNKIGEQNEHKG
jgi:phage terminase large subunit